MPDREYIKIPVEPPPDKLHVSSLDLARGDDWPDATTAEECIEDLRCVDGKPVVYTLETNLRAAAGDMLAALKVALDQVDTVWFDPKNPDDFMCPYCNQVADHIDLLEHDSDCWVKLAQDAIAKAEDKG